MWGKSNVELIMNVVILRIIFCCLSLIGALLMIYTERLGKWSFIVGVIIWLLFGVVSLFPQLLLFTGIF